MLVGNTETPQGCATNANDRWSIQVADLTGDDSYLRKSPTMIDKHSPTGYGIVKSGISASLRFLRRLQELSGVDDSSLLGVESKGA